MDLFATPIVFYTRFDSLALLTEFLNALETEGGQTIVKETADG